MAELADALDLGSSEETRTGSIPARRTNNVKIPPKIGPFRYNVEEGFYYMERRPSEWLKIVKFHVEKDIPMTVLLKKYKIDSAKLKYKIKLYQIHGGYPFSDAYEKRIYTREEKLKAIQSVLKGEKSGRQVGLELGVPGADTVNDWVKLYKDKGEAAIQISRGRKKYMLHEDRQKYLAEKELKVRCKHLEDENEFLKKSLALALRKDKRLKKRYKSLMSLRAKSN